jgi:hypothetical protein
MSELSGIPNNHEEKHPTLPDAIILPTQNHQKRKVLFLAAVVMNQKIYSRILFREQPLDQKIVGLRVHSNQTKSARLILMLICCSW